MKYNCIQIIRKDYLKSYISKPIISINYILYHAVQFIWYMLIDRNT